MREAGNSDTRVNENISSVGSKFSGRNSRTPNNLKGSCGVRKSDLRKGITRLSDRSFIYRTRRRPRDSEVTGINVVNSWFRNTTSRIPFAETACGRENATSPELASIVGKLVGIPEEMSRKPITDDILTNKTQRN